MTETPYAIAHGFAIVVPAPEGVGRAISQVMERHEEELSAALEPFGLSLTDLLEPTWMRAVKGADVEVVRSPDAAVITPEQRAAFETFVAEVPLTEVPDLLAPRGGCCGSGIPCSPEFCGGGDDLCDEDLCGAEPCDLGKRAPMHVDLGERAPACAAVRGKGGL